MGTVARIATPITAQDLANAISDVWESVVGGPPGQAIPVFIAQSAFETGDWKWIWNYNVGNIAGTGPTGDSYAATANPQSGVTSAQAPHVWRSYDTLAEGVTDWLKIFAQGYPNSVAAAVKADIPGFIDGLWQGWGSNKHYFQGDTTAKAQYQAGVQRFYNQYRNVAPTSTPPSPPSSATPVTVDPVPDSEPPASPISLTDFSSAVKNIIGNIPSMPSLPSPSLPASTSGKFLASWGMPLVVTLGLGVMAYSMRPQRT
jgi:hypothetical protein